MYERREKKLPCCQTSNGGPLQRIVLKFSSSLIPILRRGVEEAYITHVEFSAQGVLEEHRLLSCWVITSMGSRQRLIFAVGWSRDEKQAMPSVWGVLVVQQVFG